MKMTTAVKLHRRPCFSFADVDIIGGEFAHLCLARVLLFAAHHGHPAGAVNLAPTVSAQLHSSLQDVGALMPDYGRDTVLGASEELTIVLHSLRQGRHSAAQVAFILGCSELAAEAQLSILDYWGLSPTPEHTRTDHLSIAA